MSIRILLYIAFSSHVAHATSAVDPVISHPQGIGFAVEKALPPPGKIWFADKFLEYDQFKASPFNSINTYLEKTTGAPLISDDDRFVYVAKTTCRLKNTPEFLDKNRFLSFEYQKAAMPTIDLKLIKNNPFELFAIADLFGFITLEAALFPKFLDDQDIQQNPDSQLLLQITPVNLPVKIMSVRITGKFNQMISRLVMSGNFYQISDTELLATSHVLVSIDKGWKTSGIGGGLFQSYLARFIKKTMVEGVSKVEGAK